MSRENKDNSCPYIVFLSITNRMFNFSLLNSNDLFVKNVFLNAKNQH